MSPDEMLLGEHDPILRSRTSLVGRTVRGADIRRRISVTKIDCKDDKIEVVARALEDTSEVLGESEETVDLDEALARLFGVLFECSECCFGVPEVTSETIEYAEFALARNARWLSSGGAKSFATAISGLRAIVQDQSERDKGRALVELLMDRADKSDTWAVVARSPSSCAGLKRGLQSYGLAPSVAAITSLTAKNDYDGIVVAAWPNDARFRGLIDLAVAPEIAVLAYQFEKKWFERYQARARQRDAALVLTAEQRAQIVQLPPSLLNGQNYHDPFGAEHQAPIPDAEEPVFKFEARITRRHASLSVPLGESPHELRPARLVRFAGGCHAFLTQWAELPVLNEVIERGGASATKIGRKTVAKFIAGDFLLFRAAGDKEFIKLIAEEVVGADDYARQRSIAERWKTALHALGSSPSAVQRRLADYGLDRTSVTVGSWLGDPNKIGPGDDHDIEVIAQAAGDTELQNSLHEVTEAISAIRNAHLTAGMHLTRLILDELRARIDDIRDEPTRLDLGFGQAWVVQVEHVDFESISCPANKTNKLLWDSDAEL